MTYHQKKDWLCLCFARGRCKYSDKINTQYYRMDTGVLVQTRMQVWIFSAEIWDPQAASISHNMQNPKQTRKKCIRDSFQEDILITPGATYWLFVWTGKQCIIRKSIFQITQQVGLVKMKTISSTNMYRLLISPNLGHHRSALAHRQPGISYFQDFGSLNVGRLCSVPKEKWITPVQHIHEWCQLSANYIRDYHKTTDSHHFVTWYM